MVKFVWFLSFFHTHKTFIVCTAVTCFTKYIPCLCQNSGNHKRRLFSGKKKKEKILFVL